MNVRIVAFSRLVVMLGLALWLSVAVLNNLTDPGTNRALLGHTLSMDLLRADEGLGAGLLWRAWPGDWSRMVLYAVAALQSGIAVLLWRAAYAYFAIAIHGNGTGLAAARHAAVLALSCFLMLWMGFICGGLWFGYWLKQGPVQSVHMMLILISLGALLYVQNEPHALASSLPARDLKS